MHATQSNCCSALDFLSYEPCPSPKRLKLNALITRSRKSYSSVSTSRELKRLKKSNSDWLNSGYALIQWVKNAIFVFPVLPGNAEAQVTWGGIPKRLLNSYFIGNISAKKYRNLFTCVKVIASQRWDVFLRHGVHGVSPVHASTNLTDISTFWRVNST